HCHLLNPHSFPTRRSSDLPRHRDVDVDPRGGAISSRGGPGIAGAWQSDGLHAELQSTRDGDGDPAGLESAGRILALFFDEEIAADRKSTRLNSSHVAISYA